MDNSTIDVSMRYKPHKFQLMRAFLRDGNRKYIPAQPWRSICNNCGRTPDVVSLHCPLTAETRGLIGAKELARMKSDAILINTARGGIVDELALANALHEGQLGGAGMDVLSSEPPNASQPLLQPGIPNLIVTPHCAWASQASRQRLLNEIAENIEVFFAGKERNRVG